MGKRIIIHVGMPKTGTSAIQNYLYKNRNILKDYGYYYPDLISDMRAEGYRVECREEGLGKNGVVFNQFRNSIKNKMYSFNNDTKWLALEKILKEYLKNYNIIVSDEDLWCQPGNLEIIRQLKSISGNVTIVVYLRRQDLEVEALWNQVVKRYGYCTDDFNVAKKRWENDSTLKYYENLQNIEQIVGLKNMIVKKYETVDIVEDFLNVLKIQDNKNFEIEVGTNDRLSGSSLNIKREMNVCLDKSNWISGIVEEYFMDSLQYLEKTQKEKYYNDEERTEIINKFDDENYDILNRYFENQEGEKPLFNKSIPNGIGYSDNINLKDVIKIFTNIAMKQEEKIVKLESQINKLRMDRIKEQLNGRKLTLFGAGYLCSKFMDEICKDVDLVIDNNINKSNSLINGVIVKHPENIDDWDSRFIIITCGDYDNISKQLIDFGLIEGENYITYLG